MSGCRSNKGASVQSMPVARRLRRVLAVAMLAAALIRATPARADPPQMRESLPAAGSTIRGRHAEYVIRFDRPVDHAASRLEITQSGHVVQSLRFLLDSAPDVLFASGEAPAPGHYRLHWQATSSADRTVAAGDIPFSVAQ